MSSLFLYYIITPCLYLL